ncbi:ATP-binding cassette domain-containing protein, partial [Pseudomonas sp. BGM005]|nr:ATP-binding cassette domain-containing protein [Pseudomonas sp. BG5]
MITAEGLTKRFGDKTAVDGVSFSVQPGTVTGFLGPNGAGKSTTMRMIVGLDRPTSGTATVGGREYRKLRAPLTEVGVLLDAKAV